MTQPALGSDTVIQVGIVVHDIEAKERAWSEILGLPMPEIITTDTVEKARTEYQGQPTTARARLAFFCMGQIDIELIEPFGEPSTWKDHLDQHGESLHHLAFRIKGMSERIAYLNGTGIPCPGRRIHGRAVCVRRRQCASAGDPGTARERLSRPP